jgi:hypothetical protein
VLAQARDERVVDRRRRGGRALGKLECGAFGGAEVRLIAPAAVTDGADLGVADPGGAAPGSVQVLSERAADDGADAQVEQVAKALRRLAGARQPARHRARAERDVRHIGHLARRVQYRAVRLLLGLDCIGQLGWDLVIAKVG